MGISILELVIRELRQAHFQADIAYPGQKFPRITEPAAAVHIEKVDRAGMIVTVEVNILCPATVGGTTCELEALRATETLRGAGAVCVQNGCSYDGVAQVYIVQILATFTGITEADSCEIWPGFYVYLNNVLQLGAVAVSTEEVSEVQLEYAMGETAVAKTYQGGRIWNIRLEELIRTGAPEPAEPESGFIMKVETDRKTEIYSGCRWTSIHREYTKEGLRRIRKGIALSREEE